jgi:hypothetical protein
MAAGRRCLVDPVFQLWDTDSGNLVNEYETEEAALEIVLRALEDYGPADVETLALGRLGAQGAELIAEGAALAARAQRILHRLPGSRA